MGATIPVLLVASRRRDRERKKRWYEAVLLDAAQAIATCSSSLRDKTDVRPFAGGMDIVNRLRPISFNWKEDGTPDIGLGAEDVEQIEPLLTFRNDKGVAPRSRRPN